MSGWKDKMKGVLDTARENSMKAASAAAKGIEKGWDVAGRGMEKGLDQMGKGLEKGIEGAAKGMDIATKLAGEAVDGALKKGNEITQNLKTQEQQKEKQNEILRHHQYIRSLYNYTLARRQDEWCKAENLTVLTATWNVAERIPPDTVGAHIRKLFKLDGEKPSHPDILAIALQEVDMTAAAMVEVVRTEQHRLWEAAIDNAIKECKESEYIRLSYQSVGGIAMIVYCEKKHERFILNKKEQSSKTGGALGVVGNKGAASVRFSLYYKRFMFVGCHFPPHQGGVEKRNAAFKGILQDLRFLVNTYSDDLLDFSQVEMGEVAQSEGVPKEKEEDSESDEKRSKYHKFDNRQSRFAFASQHDYVFWVGDLNYRVDKSNDEVRKRLSNAEGDALQREIDALLTHDQLRAAMSKDEVFVGFEEAPITFKPTYKFDYGTDVFDTSPKARVPSWTDRCLVACPPSSKEIWLAQHKLLTTPPSSSLANLVQVGGQDSASAADQDDKPGARGSWKTTSFIEVDWRKAGEQKFNDITSLYYAEQSRSFGSVAEALQYYCIHECMISDHRPVGCLYSCRCCRANPTKLDEILTDLQPRVAEVEKSIQDALRDIENLRRPESSMPQPVVKKTEVIGDTKGEARVEARLHPKEPVNDLIQFD